MTPVDFLARALDARLAPPARKWFAASLDRARAGIADRDLFLLLGFVPRHVGKEPLALDDEALAAAATLRPGWDPRDWTRDEAARIALLVAATPDAGAFAARLERLCTAADVGELVAWYRGLPLYPAPERLRARAAEGVRSNMRSVFEAVAHRNPYPAEQFDDVAWNQMVLKALFVGAALAPIAGFDARRNETLARMLVDYARERHAASRPVSPELFRGVEPWPHLASGIPAACR